MGSVVQKMGAVAMGAVVMAAAAEVRPPAALAVGSPEDKWWVYGEYKTRDECEEVRQSLRRRFKETFCGSARSFDDPDTRYVQLWVKSPDGQWRVYGEYKTRTECEDARQSVRRQFREASCDSAWSFDDPNTRYVQLWVK